MYLYLSIIEIILSVVWTLEGLDTNIVQLLLKCYDFFYKKFWIMKFILIIDIILLFGVLNRLC